MKRWDWSWDEPSAEGARRTPRLPPIPARIAGSPQALAAQFRRRRTVAALASVALLALLIAAIGSSGAPHHAGRSPAPTPPPAHVSASQPAPSPTDTLTPSEEARAIDAVRAYTPVVVQGGAKGDEVALTFDDGPGPYTQRVVALLNALHVHATFFAIGLEERYFSAGTAAEVSSGDAIGDHTESHPMMASLSAHDQREQLLEQTYRIELAGAPAPRLFRPPYGSFDADTFKQLHALHMLMVLWSTDTRDFARPGVPTIVQSALAGAHPGAIILMHDAGGERSQTIAALPAIVHGLRARGLRPVTVGRLLRDDPPPPGQPIPHSLAGD
jgi:peptidoglycan/xylan/chitin deacetylase (PgdA/CDA1 family)